VEGKAAPGSRLIRFWRGHPEIPFALCLGFLFFVDFGGVTANSWVSWTFQELTLQRIPDPVVPFTVGATVVTAVVLTWILSPRIGWIRAALVGVSTPVGAVGVFEIAFAFILYPASFWVPAHLDVSYWGYAFAVLSYALFGLVGGGWWKVPRWWWYLLLAVAAGFSIWYAAGVPLTVPSMGGHDTPSNLLGAALVGNVALKWAVFVLLGAPVVVGARDITASATASMTQMATADSRRPGAIDSVSPVSGTQQDSTPPV